MFETTFFIYVNLNFIVMIERHDAKFQGSNIHGARREVI